MDIKLSDPHLVMVFGSNLAGRHGLGSAVSAKKYFGARYGAGDGFSGRSYGIPTKDEHIKTRSLEAVTNSIYSFTAFSSLYRRYTFLITRVGCGLAGFHDEDIAPLFAGVGDNCILPTQWREIIGVPERHIALINDIQMEPGDFKALASNFSAMKPSRPARAF